jgi:hypothetical protein
MALPTMKWRYVGSSTYGANLPAALDAIYTLGTATTYYDGSARTPGSGQAATYSRFQASGTTEAVYATPATSTALAAKWIFAGSASAKSPTMASPDTWATNHLLVSINKNSGAFNAWDAAAPFTSGQFFGYWRAWDTVAGSGSCHMWECEEAVMLFFVASGGTVRACCAGAFIDPHSTDAADAESDERVYGIYNAGGANVSTASGNSGANTSWMGYGAANDNCHTGIFFPGLGTIQTIKRITEYDLTLGMTHRLTSGSYLYFQDNMLMSATASPYAAIGNLRGMGTFGLATVGQVLSDGVNDIAYIIGVNGSTAGDAALLFRNV